eukprot:g1363.t1
MVGYGLDLMRLPKEHEHSLKSLLGRRLFSLPRWNARAQSLQRFNACPDNLKVALGVAADYGFVRAVGGQQAASLLIDRMFNDIGTLFAMQLGVQLTISFKELFSGDSQETWNDAPNHQGTCGKLGNLITSSGQLVMDGVERQLSSFGEWRAKRAPDAFLQEHEKAASWMLLTDCFPPPGTVGIANVASLCEMGGYVMRKGPGSTCTNEDRKANDGCYSGVGISSYSPNLHITIAHELGHIFGAGHNSNPQGSGDPRYGTGIMSYNEQTPQVFQRSDAAIICRVLAERQQDSPQCFRENQQGSSKPVCGNGILEDGEQCDDTSPCCSSSDCVLADGATCSGSDCCDATTCRPIPAGEKTCQTTSGATGVCGSPTGKCQLTMCNSLFDGKVFPLISFGQSKPIPIGVCFADTVSKGCTVQCNLGGGNTCARPIGMELVDESTGQPVRDVYALPDNTICGTDGRGNCISGKCIEPASWRHSQFDSSAPCSKPCGGGTQVRQAKCFFKGVPVAKSQCSGIPRPAPITQACNTQPCPKWAYGSYGPCSVSCGVGTQSRTVKCIRGPSQEVVDPLNCDLSTRETSQKSCAMPSCVKPEWRIGVWSACTKPCGGGTRTRTVTCMDGAAQTLPDTSCAAAAAGADKPISVQPCNTQSCPTWHTYAWEACSQSCGGGIRKRKVTCEVDSNVVVVDSACSGDPPTTVEICNSQDCVPYKWNLGPWTECSMNCGNDAQRYRDVKCTMGAAIVPDDSCASSLLPRPAAAEKCIGLPPCTSPAWKVLPEWSKCSVPCNGGSQERNVVCVINQEVVSDEQCSGSGRRPIASRICNAFACVQRVPEIFVHSPTWDQRTAVDSSGRRYWIRGEDVQVRWDAKHFGDSDFELHIEIVGIDGKEHALHTVLGDPRTGTKTLRCDFAPGQYALRISASRPANVKPFRTLTFQIFPNAGAKCSTNANCDQDDPQKTLLWGFLPQSFFVPAIILFIILIISLSILLVRAASSKSKYKQPRPTVRAAGNAWGGAIDAAGNHYWNNPYHASAIVPTVPYQFRQK